jgi:hypothetical protein
MTICSAELISVGQRNAALDVLEAVIKSKRNKSWAIVFEDILKKFLSLCTETRQPRRAKDGLIQYRNFVSSHAQGPESILRVVTSFIGDGEKSVRMVVLIIAHIFDVQADLDGVNERCLSYMCFSGSRFRTHDKNSPVLYACFVS